MKLRLRRAAAVGKHLARSTREQDIDTADVEALLSSREEYADARGGPRSGDEWREYTEGGTSRLEPTRAADRPLGPSDVFLLLSGDGSAPLEATEFRALFESLQLPLTTRQKELLFSQVCAVGLPSSAMATASEGSFQCSPVDCPLIAQ